MVPGNAQFGHRVKMRGWSTQRTPWSQTFCGIRDKYAPAKALFGDYVPWLFGRAAEIHSVAPDGKCSFHTLHGIRSWMEAQAGVQGRPAAGDIVRSIQPKPKP